MAKARGRWSQNGPKSDDQLLDTEAGEPKVTGKAKPHGSAVDSAIEERAKLRNGVMKKLIGLNCVTGARRTNNNGEQYDKKPDDCLMTKETKTDSWLPKWGDSAKSVSPKGFLAKSRGSGVDFEGDTAISKYPR